jgi:molybdopterin-guanine dinucleotide biosynthesis protein A
VLTGIILAGGRSSRMGTPKALLAFDGEPLLTHIVRTLQPLFDEIVVVAAPGQELPPLPVSVVHDDVAYQGPVGGITYGLRAARGDYAFVTSCDSAFISPSLVADLLARREGYDVVVPRWEDRLQPLLAVYRRTVLPLLEAQLASGELRPVYLFDKVRTLIVSEEEIRRIDPGGGSFFNMNTPDDYAEAVARWHAARGAGVPVRCTVELFGAARLIARTREIALDLPAGATFTHLYQALASKVPALRGAVVRADGSGLADGYACNVNGTDFVRLPDTKVQPDDNVAIVSADAGG